MDRQNETRGSGAGSSSQQGGSSARAGSLHDDLTAAKDDLSAAKDSLSDFAQEKIGEAKEKARSLFDDQKAGVCDGMLSVASSLRKVAGDLRGRDQSLVANLAERAADQVDVLGSSLKDRTVDDLVTNAQDFARRQPELFFASAAVVGFLFTRFLRSASERGRRGRVGAEHRAGPTTPRGPATSARQGGPGYSTAAARHLAATHSGTQTYQGGMDRSSAQSGASTFGQGSAGQAGSARSGSTQASQATEGSSSKPANPGKTGGGA